MARPAPSERSPRSLNNRRALTPSAANPILDTGAGMRLSTPLPRPSQDARGFNLDTIGGDTSRRTTGSRVDVRDVKFRGTKDMRTKEHAVRNQPLPVKRTAEMPAYNKLRELVSRRSKLHLNDIGQAIDGQEKYAQAALDALREDKKLAQDGAVQVHIDEVENYLKLPLVKQLQARADELTKSLIKLPIAERKAGLDKSLNKELSPLNARLRAEKARIKGEGNDAFAASLMDTLDAKVEKPDLEELSGRLSGIQAAVAKLNKDVVGGQRVDEMRARAGKFQQRFAEEKAADAKRPREVAAADFDRIERKIAQLGKHLLTESGLNQPQQARDRISAIRKDILKLSNVPGATKNPRYEAMLGKLNDVEIALAAQEGDELAKLLQELEDSKKTLDARDVEVRTDGAPNYRPDVVDAVQHRVGRVQDRLTEAYDQSDTRHNLSVKQAKQQISALQRRIEAIRNPVVSPHVEARAVVPERAPEVTKSQPHVPEVAADTSLLTHVDMILDDRSIERQKMEAEMKSNALTERLLALEEQSKHARNIEEKRHIEDELIKVAHQQEVALIREFILLSADPKGMARSLDRSAASHTSITADPIGKEVVAQIRALEDEGHTFDNDMVRGFQDADERAIAQRWLGVRHTSQMVEGAIAHLRDYHRAQIKLIELRDELVTACKSCFIRQELRAELEAARTPAERKQIVDEIMKNPEAMDRIQNIKQFLTKGVLIFNDMFRELGVPHSDRKYANAELDALVKTIQREEANLEKLKAGRMNFAGLSPVHGRTNEKSDTYSLGDESPETSSENEELFNIFMDVSERAGKLINDMKAFRGEVNETVITRFNSRLRSLEDDRAAHEDVPPELKSVFELAQAQLVDARQELAKLQKRQEGEGVLSPRANTSPEGPGRIAENVSASRETIIDLQSIEDTSEELLDQVNEALNEDRSLGDEAFHHIDRECILLSARLRNLRGQSSLPAYQTAERTLRELNDALDQYEEKALATDEKNVNRPAEVIFKNGIVTGLREVMQDGPKRAALSHYLIELNGGEGVRVDRSDDVQDVLITFLKRYPSMHPIEQKNTARSFEKIYEIMNLSNLYRDLGVNSLDQLAIRVGSKLDLHQAPANQTSVLDDQIPEIDSNNLEDLEDEEDNTAWAA